MQQKKNIEIRNNCIKIQENVESEIFLGKNEDLQLSFKKLDQ